MNDGWVSVYRKIEENPIVCKDNDYFRVWHHLLYNATHKEKEAIFGKEKIILKPGQLITGREAIANKCKVQSSKVVRILKAFKIEHQIEQQTCTKGTLITIVNWDKYQKNEHQNEQQMNNERTTNEQQMNTNNNEIMKQCNNEINNKNISSSNNKDLFSYTEEAFGRTFNGIEYEMINNWEDNELTRHAIEQSILNGARKLNYVEKVLSNYKKEGIKTVEEAKAKEEEYQKNKAKKEETKKVEVIKTDVDERGVTYQLLSNGKTRFIDVGGKECNLKK